MGTKAVRGKKVGEMGRSGLGRALRERSEKRKRDERRAERTAEKGGSSTSSNFRSTAKAAAGNARRRADDFRERVNEYDRNVLKDFFTRNGMWILFNLRYATVYALGLGGRLAKLPARNERPMVAGLIFFYALLMAGSMIFDFTDSVFTLALPFYVGLIAAYVVGAYFLVMETPSGETIAGLALAVDIIIFPGNWIAQAIKLFIFTLFLLICITDWRKLVTLPPRPQ